MERDLYIGLMSGTSLDGIDAVIVNLASSKPMLVCTYFCPFPAPLKKELLTLFTPGDNELERMGPLDKKLGQIFADTCQTLLEKAGVSATEIKAIGCHGQTIRHRPLGSQPFTLQIGDPNIIAEQTGICTVADFRRRDMAVGGQGAPLAPAFHKAFFQTSRETRIILNIGGLSNITVLPSDPAKPVIGFDTGPGNGLLDAWIQKYSGKEYDDNGDWAKSGQVDTSLLGKLLNDPFFNFPPPKSTGKEYFNLAWLEKTCPEVTKLSPADIQSTLLQLSAESIALAIRDYASDAEKVFICGGGAHNTTLLTQLDKALPIPVATTEELGTHPDWMEAMAFAWLARRTLMGLAGNLPNVTDAKKEVVLGSIYPAGVQTRPEQ